MEKSQCIGCTVRDFILIPMSKNIGCHCLVGRCWFGVKSFEFELRLPVRGRQKSLELGENSPHKH